MLILCYASELNDTSPNQNDLPVHHYSAHLADARSKVLLPIHLLITYHHILLIHMIIQMRANDAFKRNDETVYKQQIKFLTKTLNTDNSIVLYVIYYLLLLFDGSLILFILRCFMQMFISHVIEDAMDNNEIVPGLTRSNALQSLTGQNISGVGNGGTSNEVDEFRGFIGNLSMDQKKFLIRKLIAFMVLIWGFMFAYQLSFCMGNTFDGICYDIFGRITKTLKDSAYIPDYLNSNKLWNVNEAFDSGYLLISVIGEMRFRNPLTKYFTIILLDIMAMGFQFLAIIIDYGIGFGMIDRFTSNDEVENERRFDGMQGKTCICRIDPIHFLKKIYS